MVTPARRTKLMETRRVIFVTKSDYMVALVPTLNTGN